MGFNLYSILTEEDKDILNKYIAKYGIAKKYFMGLEEWLTPWGKNKIGLYHLLGDKLFYSVPFVHETPKNEIRHAFESMLWDSEAFTRFFREIRSYAWDRIPEPTSTHITRDLINSYAFLDNSLSRDIVLDFNSNKKKVVLSKGMKPMKALLKYIKYISTEENEARYLDIYEQIRLEHSRILNTKKITGEIVMSIHPMDFITMSDNSYNWTSCMSWTKDGGGCYRIGSTEMMFSNCVICCFLKTNEKFIFDEEETSWNSKKWRQLFYVTKDIIVGGKSYPYANDELTNIILKTLKELAEKNKGWHYSFGPEEYLDMKSVYEERDFDSCRYDIQRNKKNPNAATQHRILFETRGMYNDMVNDHDKKYLCVRNKVKNHKIINLSGKSACLCCGNEVIYEEEYYDEYNERYSNCGSLICEVCKDEKFKCSRCCCNFYTEGSVFYIVDGNRYCEECFENFKLCPDTKEMLNIGDMTYSSHSRSSNLVVVYTPKANEQYNEEDIKVALNNWEEPVDNLLEKYGFAPLFMSYDVKQKKYCGWQD